MARNRSILDQDVPVTELTSFQLIIGICIALIVCLVCFLLGVVVGRSEGHFSLSPFASNAEGTSGAQAEASAGAGEQKPLVAKNDGLGRQTWPNVPNASVPQGAVASGSDRSPRRTSLPAPPPRGPMTKDLPAPPSAPASTAGVAIPSPVRTIPAIPARERAAAPQDTETKVQEAASASSATLAEPPVAPAKASVEPALETTPIKKTETPAASGKRFTVQVVAYDAKNRQQAEGYKKLLESNSDLKATIVPSEDGKYMRVFVGDYASRAEADKACKSLQERAGFKKCFVREKG